MTKLLNKNSLKQISKFFAMFCVIFLSLNTVTLHFEAQAADLDTDTFDAALDAPIYYGFSGCASGLTIVDTNAGGTNTVGENLRASSQDSYGNDDCTIIMAYNDPDTDFEVYLYEKHDRELRHDDYATNSQYITDIDNDGSDYYIDSSGTDTTDEEWGYRLQTVGTGLALATGITVNTDGTYAFNANACGSGSDKPCTFDLEYSTGSPTYTNADNVMSGDNSTPKAALCTDVSETADCKFNLVVDANIIYSTAPGHYGGDVSEEYYPIVLAIEPGAQ